MWIILVDIFATSFDWPSSKWPWAQLATFKLEGHCQTSTVFCTDEHALRRQHEILSNFVTFCRPSRLNGCEAKTNRKTADMIEILKKSQNFIKSKHHFSIWFSFSYFLSFSFYSHKTANPILYCSVLATSTVAVKVQLTCCHWVMKVSEGII